jgi:hypothetical protein
MSEEYWNSIYGDHAPTESDTSSLSVSGINALGYSQKSAVPRNGTLRAFVGKSLIMLSDNREDSLSKSAGERIRDALNNISQPGVILTDRADNNMKLDDLRALNNYDYIYICSHGNVPHFTVEYPWAESLIYNLDDVTADDIDKDRIIAVLYSPIGSSLRNGMYRIPFVKGEEEGWIEAWVEAFKRGSYFAVLPKFFTDYYAGGQLNNPIVVLDSCLLLHGSELAPMPNALLEAGAICVIGYDETVQFAYALRVSEILTQHLLSGDSVETARNAAISEAGPDDASYGGVGAHFTIRTDTNPRNIYLVSGDVPVPDPTGDLITKLSKTWRPVSVKKAIQGDATTYTYTQISPVTNKGVPYNSTLSFSFEVTSDNGYVFDPGGELYVVNNSYSPPYQIIGWDPAAVFNALFVSENRLERSLPGVIAMSFELLPSGQVKYTENLYDGRIMEIIFELVN